MRFVAVAALFLGLAWSGNAHAFPELVRHGYANCVSCHVNVGGGGVLTEYGREISREILSTWGAESEAALGWGLVRKPEWLEATALFRGLQVVQSRPATTGRPAEIEGRAVLMQADLEVAAKARGFTAVAAAGYQDDRQGSRSSILSRRHFLSYQATDELSFRAGRFYPVYGLMIADHQRRIRRGLGWDQGAETYAFDASWVGEQFSGFAALSLGQNLDRPEDRAGVFTGEWFFGNRFKAGLSAQLGRRKLLGPHVALGFTPHFFYLGEADLLQEPSGTRGLVQYQKLSWELFQGFHLFGVQEFSRGNFAASSSTSFQYGPGIQWFPRPHFELTLSWEWLRFPGLPALDSSLGLAMLNVYL
jgi:hypothetical protein